MGRWRSPLERVAGADGGALELDHERVDIDLVAGDGDLPRLADGLAAGIDLAEPEAGQQVPVRAGRLVQHLETGAALGVAKEADGRLQRLGMLAEHPNLRIPVRECALHLAARGEDQAVG